ncbi:GntR family transcriptional regulator [Cellulosilyticum sp. I15G10I2]|uniref:GntR family transcriptional regulator n=1 Tax=Cellulosilyticum sp. I15G10I2 TaxID=1892843 RepID=UPI000A620470|nr:GntR family transcriptional regulator [Cellulosilyticum sp. I15G10I2]
MDKKSPIPAYYQLATEIEQKIDAHVWLPGYCIPSERSLAETYQLSRMTVRQALGELVQKGILVREKGKGTFVCEKSIKQRNIMSFTEMMQGLGIDFTTEVICFDKIYPEEDMFLPFEDEEVYLIKRLRIVKGVVIGEETIYIPSSLLPDLKKSDIQSSFYKYLDEKGLSVYESDASIQAVLMNETYYETFGVTQHLPLIQVTSKNYSDEGALIFVEESVYRSDKYMFQVNVARREGYLK